MKKVFNFLIFAVIFGLSVYHPSDADLGWHLKYGEYAVTHQRILFENVFPQALPNYRWVNISWLTDLVSYQVYIWGGFGGLAILSAAIITLAFGIIDRTYKPALWIKFVYPLAIWVGFHTFAYSFRGQIVSFLFLVTTICVLYRYRLKPHKWVWILLLVFWLWANMHGQFLVGLAVLLGYGGWLIWKKHEVKFLWLMPGTFLVTLFNPFGYKIYTEGGSFFLNSATKFISEWQSPIYNTGIFTRLLVWMGVWITAIYLSWKNNKTKFSPELLISGVLAVATLLSRRYETSSIAVSLPVVILGLGEIKFKTQSLVNILVICGWSVISFWAILNVSINENIGEMSWDKYCNLYLGCSPKGASYLINHKLTEKVFTPYMWGGWLIWNYPQIKPYADGRMNLWQQNGVNPFLNSLDWENGNRHIDDSEFQTVFVSKLTPLYKYMGQLENWESVYTDNRSGIWVRAGFNNK